MLKSLKVLSKGFLILGLAILGLFQYQKMQELSDEAGLNNRLAKDTLAKTTALERERLNLQRYLPAFGFRNLFSDWIFINFLIYFGDDELRAETDYQLSPQFFEIILDLDPYFADSYLFLTGSTTLYAGQPEKSVSLIERGLESLGPGSPPRSYLVWRYKAIDELLFLGRTAAAQASFETAADWAEQSDDPDATNIGEVSRRTAEFLADDPDSRAAQIGAWTSIFTSAFDERAQALAQQRIEALGGIIEVLPNGAVQVRIPE